MVIARHLTKAVLIWLNSGVPATEVVRRAGRRRYHQRKTAPI
jgi:hypothetical protein